MKYLTPLLVMTAMLTWGCQNEKAAAPSQQETRPLQERLAYAKVKPASEKALVTLPAWVTANPSHRLELSPPVEGKVAAILVAEGTFVEAFTPLARLQVPSLTGTKNIEAAAKARLDAAEARLAMEQEKLALGIATRSDVQAATAIQAEAKLALNQLQAKRKAGESSGLDDDGKADRTLVWRAPRTGMVTEIHIHQGQGISANDIAFSMVDANRLEVAVRVPERHLSAIDHQARLSWRPTGIASESEALVLDFARRGALVDEASRTVTWYFKGLHKGNPHANILPGRTGRGTILLPTPSNLWRVPRRAVCKLSGMEGIFVAGSDPGQPQFLEVEVLGRIEDDLLIRSTQIQGDSEVVVSGTFLLKSILLLGKES